MSQWRSTTLDHLVHLQRGYDLPTPTRRKGAIPVIGAGGISGMHNLAAAKGPGVTIGRAGAMGKVTFCKSDFWPLNTTLFVTDFLGNDPRFSYYLLGQIDFSGFNSGAAQPMLNRNYIKQIPIALPEPREQQKISNFLGALDDKIEVNDRIAKTCLDLADLHFTSFSSALTPGPETFATVAEVTGGGTPSTRVEEYWSGDIPWATPSDVTGLTAPYLFDTSREISETGLSNCASRLYPPGSIFMTSRATIGAFAIPQQSTAVNQGFIVVTTLDERLRWWLFHEMRSRVDEMIGLANGSTFLELSRTNFKHLPVRTPSENSLTDFFMLVDPLHKRGAHALNEARSLTNLRDTLLPELMSGRLRVRDAEHLVEDAT